MANAINKLTLEYLESINTPDYESSEWIINPVLPNCEKKYWKIVDDTVQEMDKSEKDDVDAAELAAQTQAEEDAKDIELSWSNPECYKRFVRVLLDEINILRNKHSLANRTVEQLKDAVKNKEL